MAYLTQRAPGRWELRESVSTDRGPRSRTLASFDRLTDDVLAHAAQRASRPFDPAAVRAAARRASVPVGLPHAEQAARTLAALLERGESLPPALAGVLMSQLAGLEPAPVSDSARSAAAWADASPQERGEALHDLLLLGDALPTPPSRRAESTTPQFPRLTSTPAPAA